MLYEGHFPCMRASLPAPISCQLLDLSDLAIPCGQGCGVASQLTRRAPSGGLKNSGAMEAGA